MTDPKRYNPLIIVFELWKLVKSSAFFIIFLFLIKYDSDAAYVKYGRIAILLYVGLSIIYIFVKWFTHKYKLDDTSFHIYKGVYTKTKQTIPFVNIQNINRHISVLHRMFKVTSIRLETGMSGDDAAIEFKVISPMEADYIEKHIRNPILAESKTIEPNETAAEISGAEEQPVDDGAPHRTVHFKPTKRDLLKASFTSLSFLILPPLLASLYTKINDIFHVEKEAEGLLSTILDSWWLLTIIVVAIMIISIPIGIIRTFFKYGEYEISSDEDRIYIKKGVVEKTAFSISKQKVQAVEITQSALKRMLGLAEVKLISAGETSKGDEKLEVSSLYPFLPVQRAYEMISEILPSYNVTEEMSRLPKKSLWIRMLTPSWFWLIATGALYYFKPKFLGWEDTWWIASIALFVSVYVSRLLNFFHSRYTLNQNYIQIKTGSLTTSLFVSKREKIIEVKLTRGLFQRKFGLASISTVNRAKPVRHTYLNDIPTEMADSFYTWYMERSNEIKVE